MLEIKNLSQLKKAVNTGHCFRIRKHYIHPEYTGQMRKPSVIQTNGFYSTIPDDPDCKISKANGGKGYWFDYGKAKDWQFHDGVCIYNRPDGKAVWEIIFE